MTDSPQWVGSVRSLATGAGPCKIIGVRGASTVKQGTGQCCSQIGARKLDLNRHEQWAVHVQEGKRGLPGRANSFAVHEVARIGRVVASEIYPSESARKKRIMYTWPEEIAGSSDPLKEAEEALSGLTLLRQARSAHTEGTVISPGVSAVIESVVSVLLSPTSQHSPEFDSVNTLTPPSVSVPQTSTQAPIYTHCVRHGESTRGARTARSV